MLERYLLRNHFDSSGWLGIQLGGNLSEICPELWDVNLLKLHYAQKLWCWMTWEIQWELDQSEIKTSRCHFIN